MGNNLSPDVIIPKILNKLKGKLSHGLSNIRNKKGNHKIRNWFKKELYK